MEVFCAPARISTPTSTTKPWNSQAQPHSGPTKIHGHAADQIPEVIWPDAVGNDHHREKRDQRGEQQAVDENHQSGFFQILQLGMGDLAVDLRQGLFAAHGQYGMAEADEQR